MAVEDVQVWSVGDKTARFGEIFVDRDDRQPTTRGEAEDFVALFGNCPVINDEYSLRYINRRPSLLPLASVALAMSGEAGLSA